MVDPDVTAHYELGLEDPGGRGWQQSIEQFQCPEVLEARPALMAATSHIMVVGTTSSVRTC